MTKRATEDDHAPPHPFLEVSPFEVDGGNFIGVDPRKIPVPVLRALGHPESYPKIIRAKCLDCVCGAGEVRKCVQTSCPLWPVRMGANPFHKKGGR